MTTITIEMLENQKKSLQKEMERIQKELKLTEDMIAIRKGQEVVARPGEPSKKTSATSYSIRGRVVDTTIELIHSVGKQVENKEILTYLTERGISLGDTKNKQGMLNAILSQEVKKKSARLKKVARGVYDIK